MMRGMQDCWMFFSRISIFKCVSFLKLFLFNPVSESWRRHFQNVPPWGGAKRDKLLKDFVCRCFSPQDDFNKNKACVIYSCLRGFWNYTWPLCFALFILGFQAKLTALVTLRQRSRQFRRNLQGYSWKTEAEMGQPPLSWSRQLATLKAGFWIQWSKTWYKPSSPATGPGLMGPWNGAQQESGQRLGLQKASFQV